MDLDSTFTSYIDSIANNEYMMNGEKFRLLNVKVRKNSNFYKHEINKK